MIPEGGPAATRLRVAWALLNGGLCSAMAVGAYLLAGSWVATFAQVSSPGKFLFLFFLLVAAVSYLSGSRLRRVGGVKWLVVLSALGHLLAIISLLAVQLSQSGGWERFENTTRVSGPLAMTSILLVMTLPLGGWLVLPVAYALVRRVFRSRVFEKFLGIRDTQ